MFDTVDDANARLNNCILRYDQKIIRVEGAHQGGGEGRRRGNAIGRDPESGRMIYEPSRRARTGSGPIQLSFRYLKPMNNAENGSHTKNIQDKKFDPDPIPLGYIDFGGNTTYVERIPRRRYRQGLHSESLYAEGDESLASNLFTSDCLGQPLLNDYLPLVKAYKVLTLDNGIVGRAIHRDFAIKVEKTMTNLFFLYHKGVKVGWSDQKGEILLSPCYEYLKEFAEKINIKLGV